MVLLKGFRHMGTRFARSFSSVTGMRLVENSSSLATPGTVSRGDGLIGRFRALFTAKVIVPVPAVFLGAFCCNNLVQDYLGSKDDFFYASFITNKNPDDIAEFYQAEDLLKIISFHPFLFKMFMDRVVVGKEPESEEEAHLSMEESRMVVQDLGMEASFVISEEEEEIDGETKKVSFQRWERFLDYVPGLHDQGTKILLWDQTWTFGFRRLEDGRTEVYHRGEKFYGPWPIRMIIQLHQRYVIWACERYLSMEAFGSDEDDALERREDELSPTAKGATAKILEFVGDGLNWCENQVQPLRALKYAVPERSGADKYLTQIMKSTEDSENVKITKREGAHYNIETVASPGAGDDETDDAETPSETEFPSEVRQVSRINGEMPHYNAWRKAPLASYARTISVWRLNHQVLQEQAELA